MPLWRSCIGPPQWGEVRRLACPLRRFPFAAPPNCGRKGGTGSTKGGWLRRQTVRLQTGSAPWNVYSTYDRNLVRGDFGCPLTARRKMDLRHWTHLRCEGRRSFAPRVVATCRRRVVHRFRSRGAPRSR